MPVGVAALPPNFRVLLWMYYRIEKEREPVKIPSLFCHFSVKKLSYTTTCSFPNLPNNPPHQHEHRHKDHRKQ